MYMYSKYIMYLNPTKKIASWGPGYSVLSRPRTTLHRESGPYLHGMVRVKGRHFFPSETWCGDSDSLQSFGKWSFPKAGQKLQSLILILPFVRRSWTASKTPDLWTFDCLGRHQCPLPPTTSPQLHRLGCLDLFWPRISTRIVATDF